MIVYRPLTMVWGVGGGGVDAVVALCEIVSVGVCAWLAIAGVVAVVVGRAVALAERRRPSPSRITQKFDTSCGMRVRSSLLDYEVM